MGIVWPHVWPLSCHHPHHHPPSHCSCRISVAIEDVCHRSHTTLDLVVHLLLLICSKPGGDSLHLSEHHAWEECRNAVVLQAPGPWQGCSHALLPCCAAEMLTLVWVEACKPSSLSPQWHSVSPTLRPLPSVASGLPFPEGIQTFIQSTYLLFPGKKNS